MELSQRQSEILQYIRSFIGEQNYPPTYEEIQNALHISSKAVVKHHLVALEKAGYIYVIPYSPRGIRLVPEERLLQQR
jgi:repressor LexA